MSKWNVATSSKFNSPLVNCEYKGAGYFTTGTKPILLNGDLLKPNTKYILKDGDIIEGLNNKPVTTINID